jgi:light-regulated signal transduction histidine kinase (bacteriophytochrome)
MVSSYLGLLERRVGDRLDEKERSYIGFAVDGAHRMQQMISDLLTFSRAGTTTNAFAQADLTEVLERALTNLKVAREERGATVTHDPLPAAVVDASQFMQVFQNLIGNALKFCTGRKPEVHVSCERRENEWVFAVRDNGIGIAEKDFARIFGIFHRLHSRAEFEGTGIGLALVKKIVERHGGRIWVESQPGVGTAFYFTIPAEGEAVVPAVPLPLAALAT